MLTDNQKFRLKSSFEMLYSEYIKSLPSEVQIKAYQAIQSFPYYLMVIEMLKEHDIEGVVRQAGEMLSHPAPQNSHDSVVNINMGLALSSVTVATKFDQRSGTTSLARQGVFNIAVHDDEASPSSSADVRVFIQDLINEELKKLTNDEENLQVKVMGTLPEKKVTDFSPDTFLTYSIESQLEYLNITSTAVKLCDENSFKAYQLFLSQFKIPEQKCDTIEKVNVELKLWYTRCRDELEETEKYIMGPNSNNTCCFSDVVEAKLSRFNHYCASPDANFYTYRALKRIAFVNGDVSMRASLEPDYLDMAYMLMKFKENNGLEEILKTRGGNFHIYHGHMLLETYVSSNVINIQTLKTFVEKVILSVELIDTTLKRDKAQCPDKEYWYQIKKALLRALNYQECLPIKIAKEIFIDAVKRNDFECQMLVLAQSPEDFASRNLLNRENVFKLIRPEFYSSVRKIAGALYPSMLSTEDMVLISKLSNGAIAFKINYKCHLEPSVLETQPVSTPLYALRSAQQPVPAIPPAQPLPVGRETPRI